MSALRIGVCVRWESLMPINILEFKNNAQM